MTMQLLRLDTGPIVIKMHTNVNSPVIHNLTKQKLPKNLQTPPHHTKITDKFLWEIYNRIQIEEIN